ncbi:MAG: TonB-dependent receptor, partial [Calditrichaeota bacterium]|nr:TonB-dependent receptor [Calditrichota bacterium]
MRTVFLAILVFTGIFVTLSGQTRTKYTISGFVQDATSGERLIGANVFEPTLQEGTTTNSYGFFSLTLPADSVLLAVAYIGFQNEFFRLKLTDDVALNINLRPSPVAGDTIQVVADAIELIENQTQMSRIDVSVAQIRSMPALLGETDILKALQLLPGVQSGSEGASGIYVRGGGPDQNLIMLDGAPVYNASHLFGFFSVFNADAIKNVNLTKGGFPARFGGRLSSVLEINMKEGNNQKFEATGAIGVVASRLTLEGPIKKGVSSFIVSMRRTYIDILARPFMNTDEGTGGYYFYDVNAKANYAFSNNDRIYLSFYGGDDQFYAEENNDFDSETPDFTAETGWGNLTGTFRWNHLFSKKLFSNTIVTFSKYRFDITTKERSGDDSYVANYFSGIRDWSARVDFDYIPNTRHSIRFGTGITHHNFSPGAYQYNEDSDSPVDLLLKPSADVNALEAIVYIEDDVKISDDFSANIGVHASGFQVKNTTHTSLQPRVSLNYRLPGGYALKSSFASMNQYIHLLTNSGIGLPTDLWVPATDRVKPQESWQAAVGIARSLADRRYEFSFEIYYKKMNDLIEYREGANYLALDTDWQNKVQPGDGEAYGAEFFLQKKRGRTTGWLGYTLSWSNRQFASLNDGKAFPYRYDRRHDLSAVVAHDISKKWEFSTNFVFGTGAAITLPIAQIQLNPTGYNNPFLGYTGTQNIYGSRNGFRMANYHRLDVSLRFFRGKTRDGGIFTFSVYNLYSRKNPFFIY